MTNIREEKNACAHLKVITATNQALALLCSGIYSKLINGALESGPFVHLLRFFLFSRSFRSFQEFGPIFNRLLKIGCYTLLWKLCCYQSSIFIVI